MPSSMMNQVREIRDRRKPFLKHPLAQALIRGELSIEGLKGFATQWYIHAREVLPCFIQTYANVPRTPEYREVVRKMVKTMVEEEGTDIVGGKIPSHPELAMRFALSLGLSRDEVEYATPLPEERLCDSELMYLCKSSALEGLGGIGVALEAHVPESFSKYSESLRQNYRLRPEATEFWDVHVEADKEHGEDAEAMILKFVKTKEDEIRLLNAVKRGLDAIEVWYDGMYRAYFKR